MGGGKQGRTVRTHAEAQMYFLYLFLFHLSPFTSFSAFSLIQPSHALQENILSLVSLYITFGRLQPLTQVNQAVISEKI